MYFFRIEPLKQKFRECSITDREALPYLIVFSVLVWLSASIPFELWEGELPWHTAEVILVSLTTIGGFLYVYRKNGGRGGVDLVLKSYMLGWVLGVRLLCLFFPILFLVWTLFPYADWTLYLADLLTMLALQVAFFWWLGKHCAESRPASS